MSEHKSMNQILKIINMHIVHVCALDKNYYYHCIIVYVPQYDHETLKYNTSGIGRIVIIIILLIIILFQLAI